jgi:pyruvate formate lyase activating enzyme
MCQWIKRELGSDVPLHFSAFHPDYKMPDIPATPPATLERARNVALLQGLNYVYTGNVHHQEGDTTFCPNCHEILIERDWYQINQYRMTANAQCPDCSTSVAGNFDAQAGSFGRRRIPITLNRR